MDVINLPKEIYERATELGVTIINLSFSGGNDEGYLNVFVNSKKRDESSKRKIHSLESDINEWAWDAYDYNGAGDGSAYGDDITYDLEKKKVFTSSWHTTRVDGEQFNNDLEIE